MYKGIKEAEMECAERAHRLKSQLIKLVLEYGDACLIVGDVNEYSKKDIIDMERCEEEIMKYIGILHVD